MTNYYFTGANGDSVVFDNANYVLNSITGHGVPATKVRIDESAGAGGTWRYSKRGVRNIDLAVTVMGTSEADVQTKLRRLDRIIQDTAGATTLTVTYDDGSSLSLGVHYTSGAESQWGGNTEGAIWCRWVLSFKAPQPFWQSTNSQNFTVTAGNTGRGLLPQLSKLKVSSSQSLGIVSVVNNADVPSYPVWTIRGPVAGLEISNGVQSFGFNTAVAAGQTIIVNTEAGTVVSDTGANSYGILNPAPKLFAFLPGTSTIEIKATEASTTSATYISCSYALRYEVVH